MRKITFIEDGHVFTNAIRRHGRLIFKANGFYKFPIRAEEKSDEEIEKDQVSA